MLQENKFGIILGFIFGLLSIYLMAFGLFSETAGILGLIFRFPGPLIGNFFVFQTGPSSYSTSISMPIALILNGIFYALIGMLLQHWLKRKLYVSLVFLGIIIVIILGIMYDAFLGNGITP